MSASTGASGSASTQNAFSSGGGTKTSPDFHKVLLQTTATAFTVNPGQSGHLFLLPAVGAVITLPPVSSSVGCSYTFIMSANNATTAWALTAPAGTLFGSVIQGADGAAATLKMVGTSVSFGITALRGDSVQILSDGVGYYVRCFGTAAASFTVA